MARLNSANADVDADQGEVDRLQALQGFKKIRAPFDGVVTARETDIGALINAGSGTGGGNGPELFRVVSEGTRLCAGPAANVRGDSPQSDR